MKVSILRGNVLNLKVRERLDAQRNLLSATKARRDRGTDLVLVEMADGDLVGVKGGGEEMTVVPECGTIVGEGAFGVRVRPSALCVVGVGKVRDEGGGLEDWGVDVPGWPSLFRRHCSPSAGSWRIGDRYEGLCGGGRGPRPEPSRAMRWRAAGSRTCRRPALRQGGPTKSVRRAREDTHIGD